MADFIAAYEKTIINEGGYKLHTVAGDTGGQTYAGISRRANPDWTGWRKVDSGGVPSAGEVRTAYRDKYWMPLRLDEIHSQVIAEDIFDFGVNAGTTIAAKLAQIAVGTTPDGKVGPLTIASLNSCDTRVFVLMYTVAKIARYRDIVMKDRSQLKFLLGWINRALKGVA